MSAALDRAADTIAAAILAAAQREAQARRDVSTGRVLHVQAGAGIGGVDLVTVAWKGGEITIPHSGGYVPAVADWVSLLRPEGSSQLIINDSIIGGLA